MRLSNASLPPPPPLSLSLSLSPLPLTHFSRPGHFLPGLSLMSSQATSSSSTRGPIESRLSLSLSLSLSLVAPDKLWRTWSSSSSSDGCLQPHLLLLISLSSGSGFGGFKFSPTCVQGQVVGVCGEERELGGGFWHWRGDYEMRTAKKPRPCVLTVVVLGEAGPESLQLVARCDLLALDVCVAPQATHCGRERRDDYGVSRASEVGHAWLKG